MFTDTLPSVFKTIFPATQFSAKANPATSFALYSRYRDIAMTLINTHSPEIIYRSFANHADSHNGEGIHEKFVYRGQSVLDVSVGLLDFPWFAADGNPLNEIAKEQLQQLAETELIPQVAWRLRQLANFAVLLPMHVRFYHYVGHDGVRAITILDEFSAIKMNCIITHTEDNDY